MAKVLTEQYRMWSDAASDPLRFANGAPMHSAIPFDMMRWLNNMQTYCEPSFQFVYDACGPSGAGIGSVPRIRFAPPVGTTSGVCMLGQFPVLVPIAAKRLAWHFGIKRIGAGDEVPVNLNVSDITMYLASGPCRYLHDPVTPNLTPNEASRLFDPGYISGSYTSNSVVAAATSDSPPAYKLITNDGTFGPATWTNFVGASNINDIAERPWAYFIVTATFDTAAVGESILGCDLSIWGEYE